MFAVDIEGLMAAQIEGQLAAAEDSTASTSEEIDIAAVADTVRTVEPAGMVVHTGLGTWGSRSATALAHWGTVSEDSRHFLGCNS